MYNAYIICSIDRRERALKAVHLLTANIGLAEVSA
jgi:hypothetical protein